jgi:four helix bundle protein
MQDPERLDVTRESRALAVSVYRLTSTFPRDERFGLTAQMRRAAVSIGSNIAEGCGRGGRPELQNFLHVSSGSAKELAFQLSIAAELEYGDAAGRDVVRDRINHVGRMLIRLIAAVRRKRDDAGRSSKAHRGRGDGK